VDGDVEQTNKDLSESRTIEGEGPLTGKALLRNRKKGKGRKIGCGFRV